jgi:hypothetical protein
MDRFALFIDAGHLLAEGGSLCCNTKSRGGISCNFSGLIEALAKLCENHCSLPMLRTYWYDGAKDAIPTPEQLLIAQLPWTKLRLGRLSGGKQKGVDSLIVRDLMTLARERAIATAFLLGGDEDLREGMLAAQEMGVAVNVLGIPTTLASLANQAETLIREADQHIMLPTALLARFLTPRSVAAAQSTVPPIASGQASLSSAAVVAAARDFAISWHAGGRQDEVASLIAGAPVIPKDLDVSLVRSIQGVVGASLQERDDLRKDARAAFWATVKALGSSPVSSPPNPPQTSTP